MGLVTKGMRSSRLNSPAIDDITWNIITNCWAHKPPNRPTMDETVETMKPS